MERGDVRLMQARAMSEDELESNIRDACQRLGILYFHVYDPLMMARGLPDNPLLIGQHGFLINENKSQAGRIRPEQREVVTRLQRLGAPVRVSRPSDWLDGTLPSLLREIA